MRHEKILNYKTTLLLDSFIYRYVSIQKLEMQLLQLPNLCLCEVMVFGIPKLVMHAVTSTKLRCASLCARDTECLAFSYQQIFGRNGGLCKIDKMGNVYSAAPIISDLFENHEIEGDKVYLTMS